MQKSVLKLWSRVLLNTLVLSTLSFAADHVTPRPVVTEDEPKEILPYGLLDLESNQIPFQMRKTLQEAGKAVGRVVLRKKADRSIISQGTGYVVLPGDILETNFHVLEDWISNESELEALVYFDGIEEPLNLLKVLRKDEKGDFVVVLMNKKHAHFLRTLSNEHVLPGNRIVSIGHPYGNLKKKVTFGHLVEPFSQGRSEFVLSSPSVPGESGSPAILVSRNGALVGVIGLIKGAETISNLQELPGAVRLHNEVFKVLNSNLFRLTLAPEPKKTLKITEGDKGLKSEVIANWMLPVNDPLYAVTMHNLSVYLTPQRKEELNKTLDWAIEKLENVKSSIEKKTSLWSVRDETLTALRSINVRLQQLAVSSARNSDVMFNVPSRTEKELSAWVNGSDTPARLIPRVDKFIQEIQEAKGQLTFRMEGDKKVIDFFKSEDAIAKYLLELERNPSLKESESFYNGHFLYVPALLVPRIPE